MEGLGPVQASDFHYLDLRSAHHTPCVVARHVPEPRIQPHFAIAFKRPRPFVLKFENFFTCFPLLKEISCRV